MNKTVLALLAGLILMISGCTQALGPKSDNADVPEGYTQAKDFLGKDVEGLSYFISSPWGAQSKVTWLADLSGGRLLYVLASNPDKIDSTKISDTTDGGSNDYAGGAGVDIANTYSWVNWAYWSKDDRTASIVTLDWSKAKKGWFQITQNSSVAPVLKIDGVQQNSSSLSAAEGKAIQIVAGSSTSQVYVIWKTGSAISTPTDAEWASAQNSTETFNLNVSYSGATLFSVFARTKDSGKGFSSNAQWTFSPLSTSQLYAVLSQNNGQVTMKASIDSSGNSVVNSAVIRYTLDGSTPNTSTSSFFTGQGTLNVNPGVTVTAIAFPPAAGGYSQSSATTLVVTGGSNPNPNPTVTKYTLGVSYSPAGSRPLYVFKLASQSSTASSTAVYDGSNPGASIQLEPGWYAVGAGSGTVGWLSGGAFTMTLGTLSSPALSSFQNDKNGNKQWMVTIRNDGSQAQGLVSLF